MRFWLIVLGLICLAVGILVMAWPRPAWLLIVFGATLAVSGLLSLGIHTEPAYVQVPLYLALVLAAGVVSFLVIALLAQSSPRSVSSQTGLSVGPRGIPAVGAAPGGPLEPLTFPRLKVGISAKWPDGMNMGDSGFVGATLDQSILQEPVYSPAPSPTPTTGHKLAATPVPVGTPGIPLSDAFGSNYSASASAQLYTADFVVSPNNVDWESLDQTAIRWGWSITPKTLGRQAIFVAVLAQWKPQPGAESQRLQPIERELWQSGPMYISVGQDTWVWGQFNGSVLLGGGLATAVTVLLTGLVAFVLNRFHLSKQK
jgi:hypothetical protein